ncbi:MAG: hypothetical protein PHP88_04190 [bacterium]|nr:hypothetical protein [bacterium]
MGKRAIELAERFKAFNNKLIAFVRSCTDEDWRKVCSGEQWPVGVVARHIVLGILRQNGGSVADYVAGLGDVDLDRVGHIAAAGGDMTAEQIIVNIILRSGGEHFANAKTATGA